MVGFRPDSVQLVNEGDEGIPATAEVVEELGSDAYLFASLPGHEIASGAETIIAKIDPRAVPSRGQAVRLRVRSEELHLFSVATGDRLE